MSSVGPHGDPKPLTPQERQRLVEIEEGLRADPAFVHSTQYRGNRRRVRSTVAAAVLLVGLVFAAAGAVLTPHSFLAGFVLLFLAFVAFVVGVVVWFTASRRPH